MFRCTFNWSPLLPSDLSGNPFECHCKLFRLVSWLREKGVKVRRPEAMLCDNPPALRHQPLLNVSLLTCGRDRTFLDRRRRLRVVATGFYNRRLFYRSQLCSLSEGEQQWRRGGAERASHLLFVHARKLHTRTVQQCVFYCIPPLRGLGGEARVPLQHKLGAQLHQ